MHLEAMEDGAMKLYHCTKEYMAGCGFGGNATFSTYSSTEVVFVVKLIGHREEVLEYQLQTIRRRKRSFCVVWNF
jgi:hypothetical protein